MTASIIYIVAIVAANLNIAFFGPWVSPLNAFFLIGLDFALRDYLHDKWKSRIWINMPLLIAVSGIISFLINPATGIIAIASLSAFVIAELVDTVIYQKFRDKHYLKKSNASNVGSSIADSIVFPTVAFGTLMPEIIALQFIAKFCGGFLWSLAIWKMFYKKGEVK